MRQSRTLGSVGGGARQRPLLPGPSTTVKPVTAPTTAPLAAPIPAPVTPLSEGVLPQAATNSAQAKLRGFIMKVPFVKTGRRPRSIDLGFYTEWLALSVIGITSFEESSLLTESFRATRIAARPRSRWSMFPSTSRNRDATCPTGARIASQLGVCYHFRRSAIVIREIRVRSLGGSNRFPDSYTQEEKHDSPRGGVPHGHGRRWRCAAAVHDHDVSQRPLGILGPTDVRQDGVAVARRLARGLEHGDVVLSDRAPVGLRLRPPDDAVSRPRASGMAPPRPRGNGACCPADRRRHGLDATGGGGRRFSG